MVHVPDGNPDKITLPVETVHVGWVMVPTLGAAGVTAVMVMGVVAPEVHPSALVTVYE